MVNNVDAPPIARMPDKFANDPELREYFLQQENIIYQLWLRTGGFNDDISDSGLRELYPFPNLYSQIYNDSKDTQQISADYTTTGNQVLIVTTACTVTLNSTPDNLEEVTVKHATTGLITVSGTIDDASSYRMVQPYESKTFVYLTSESKWFIV